MAMSNKKSFVCFAILSILFTFTSCIPTDKSLGNQFVPDSFVLKLDTVNFEVPVTTKAFDSIPSMSSTYMVFGYINDEKLGRVTSSSAVTISPYSDSTYLGINPKLKSIYMYMDVDSTVTLLRDGAENMPQNISVHRLLTDIDTTTIYNNSFTEKDYDPVPVSTGSPIFFGDDSLKIYLSEEFGNELLATSTAEFDSLDLFMERIKGLYFTTDNPDVAPGMGRMNYVVLGTTTIYLEFQMTDPQRGWYDKDTMLTFMVGYDVAVNSVKTSSRNLVSDQVSESLLIESYDGIKPYIKADDLKHLLDVWISRNGFNKDKVIIARAALELPYEYDYSHSKEYLDIFPQQIYPCKIGHENGMQYISPLEEIYHQSSVGNINRSLSKYTCEITGYIQDLIQTDTVKSEEDLYICPILSFTDTSGDTFYGLDNQNYRNGAINGNLAPSGRKPTLQITYSILPE